MKTPDFVKISQHIKQGRDELEPLRMRWLLAFLAAALCALVGTGASIFAFVIFKDNPTLSFATAGVSASIFLVLAYRSSMLGDHLLESFDAWRARGVQMLDSESSFNASKGFDQAVFDRSGLNTASYNRYSSNSLLSIGKTQSSYVHASDERTETYYETEHYTDSQGHQQSRQVRHTRQVIVKIFSGLLIKSYAALPHHGGLMLRAKRDGLPKGWEPLRVASPELNKNYAVGATNAFVGHRALTPSFMVRLWDYSASCKYLPAYAYRDGWLYLLIPEFWLSFGRRPSKWSAITGVTLQQCLDECQSSIRFVRDSVNRLVPNFPQSPLTKVVTR